MDIINIITLSLSGLLLFFVGSTRLSNPIKAYSKNSGIELDKEVNLLNEIRAMSSVMLFSGIIILLGIFVPEIRTSSFIVGILIFIGFVVGRLLSTVWDGKPNKKINQGIVFELILGAANIFCLVNAFI